MSPQPTDALLIHQTESKKKGLRLGAGELELVFTNEGGTVIDVNNWRRRIFNKALKKAGMRKVRIHDIRHSYATIRIQAGHNIADVSNQLGHHSIKFMMDMYYHWIPGNQKSEVDALDGLHLAESHTNPNLEKDEKI